MIPQRSVDQLEKMGIPMICIIEKDHFEDLYNNIAHIGQILHCETAADSLNRLLQQRVQSELKTHESANLPTVYYVVGFGATGNFTAGGNTFIDDIIRRAGGRNLAHDITGWSYSLESLMQNDPDYIVVRRPMRWCSTARSCTAH